MATTQSEASNQVEPIIIERKKSEPHERHTRLNAVQNAEGHLLHAYQRITKSMDTGLNTYIEARNESVKAKGDEAFADIFPNIAKGMQAAIEAIAPLPVDLVGIVYPERVREFVSDSIRGATNIVYNREEEESTKTSK